MTAVFCIARCAQPQMHERSPAGTVTIAHFSSGLNSHVFELHGENATVENIANPCGRPIRRALAELARWCSTTLSTAIVDNGKIFHPSPVYRAFLQGMATNGRKSGRRKS